MTDSRDDLLAMSQEVLRGRSFSMAEAIGRLGGAGAMKGASPVALPRQAAARVQALLEEHLDDPGGILRRVVGREVVEGPDLLAHLEQPEAAVKVYLERLLAVPAELEELVRMVDQEWGQVVGERPYFERDGLPPHPDDPYTRAGVRARLGDLARRLAVG